MTRFAARRSRLHKLVKKTGAEALLVSNPVNVGYLTGFTGDDSYLLLSGRESILLSDFRYVTQLKYECPDLKVHIRPKSKLLPEETAAVIQSARLQRVAIEAASLTVATLSQWAEKLPKVSFIATMGLVEELRQIKDKQEVEELRRAVGCAERAFARFRLMLDTTRTEKELAAELDHQMRLEGAVGSSFATIVAAGPRAALPHARPTDETVDGRQLLLVDWGADSRGYKSDLTRVLVTAKISPKLERLYGLVLRAQQQAIDAIRPGKTGQEIDAIGRNVIADAGFGKYFGHGLGHGIGLDIHELPRLSELNAKPLEAGMVVTVEPGVYLPGWGGIRIEDDVLVTRNGHEVLTSAPKALEEMTV